MNPLSRWLVHRRLPATMRTTTPHDGGRGTPVAESLVPLFGPVGELAALFRDVFGRDGVDAARFPAITALGFTNPTMMVTVETADGPVQMSRMEWHAARDMNRRT